MPHDGALAYWQRGQHTEKWPFIQLVCRLLPLFNHHDVTLVIVKTSGKSARQLIEDGVPGLWLALVAIRACNQQKGKLAGT